MTELDEATWAPLDEKEQSKFMWAWNHARTIVPWLHVAGYIQTGEVDVRVQSSSTRPLGIPATKLAAIEITNLLNELNGYQDETEVFADELGTWLARQLSREVSTADAAWPIGDKPHDVKYMGCASCHVPALRYSPPRFDGDAILVKCRACGKFMDEDGYQVAAKLLEAELCQAKTG